MADLAASDNAVRHLPRGLAAFRRLLRVVGRIELTAAIVALVVVVALSTAQALLRYSVHASLWWAQEVAENTIMVTYFLGVSYVFKTRQYIVIEFVSNLAPYRLQLAFYVVAQVLAAAFGLAVLWLVYLFLPTMMNMTSPVLKLPGFVTPTPLVLASLMIVVTSVYYLMLAIWSLSWRPATTSLYEMEAAGAILTPWDDQP